MDTASIFIDIYKWIIDINKWIIDINKWIIDINKDGYCVHIIDINKYGLNVKTAGHTAGVIWNVPDSLGPTCMLLLQLIVASLLL